MSEAIQNTVNVTVQERALISSPAFSSKEAANEWGQKLLPDCQETVSEKPLPDYSVEPFVPARWGGTALVLLDKDSQEEALQKLLHLSTQVDRSKPVTITCVHRVWSPLDSDTNDNNYFVVVIADIECSGQPSESS